MSTLAQAAVWMVGSMLSLCAMGIFGRLLGGAFSTYEIMLYRSAVGIVIMTAVLQWGGRWGDIRLQYFKLHFLRNLSHFIGQNLWFFALTLIPMAQLFALEFTTPLWVLVFSVLFLNEQLTKMRVFWAILGFGGAVLSASPGGIEWNAGTITALLSAIGFAGSITATKILTRYESTRAILFFLVWLQLGFSAVMVAVDGTMQMPNTAQAFYLAMIGVLGLSAHWCLTQALRLAPATVVVPIDFIRLPLIAAVGVAFFQEPLEFTIILGGAITFFAAYANLYGAGATKPPPPTKCTRDA